MQQDERGRAAREFWLRQGQQDNALLAVNPGGRWSNMHAWTRGMLQTWTVERMRAVRPRFRRCVDIGCGYGDWTELFARFSDEVYGCELVPAFAAAAAGRVPMATIECCDLRDYEVPADLDLVYIGAVLMYVPEPDALSLLRRVRESLAPDGLVMWREYTTFNLGRRTTYHTDGRFSVHRTPAELAWLAELAGMRVVETRSAPSIYGEVLGRGTFGWPLRGVLRLATATWRRASHTVVLRGG